MWTVFLSPGDYQIRRPIMNKKSKNSTGKGRKGNESLSKGDDLLMRLLKVKMPIVHEPEPEIPFDVQGSDEIDQAMKDHPGLTREKAEEMLKAFGF
jgi:hypothetical protein